MGSFVHDRYVVVRFAGQALNRPVTGVFDAESSAAMLTLPQLKANSGRKNLPENCKEILKLHKDSIVDSDLIISNFSLFSFNFFSAYFFTFIRKRKSILFCGLNHRTTFGYISQNKFGYLSFPSFKRFSSNRNSQ